MAITVPLQPVESTAANGNDPTITFLGSLVENDVVLVVGGHGNVGATAAGVSTGGYTSINTITNGSCEFNASYKRMGASPDTTVVCNGSGDTTDAAAYLAIVLRGVDTTTALDATTTTATGSSSAPNSPSITTVTNGAVVFSCFGALNGSGFTEQDPVNYVTDDDASRSDTVGTVQVGRAQRTIAVAGAENPAAWTPAGNPDVWVAFTIAMRPDLTVQEGATSAYVPVFSHQNSYINTTRGY